MTIIKACGIALISIVIVYLVIFTPILVYDFVNDYIGLQHSANWLLKSISYLFAGCTLVFIVAGPFAYYFLYKKLVGIVMPTIPFSSIKLCVGFPILIMLLMYLFIIKWTNSMHV